MALGIRLLAGVLCVTLPAFVAAAQTLTINVGYGPGGGYDDAARLLADHIGPYLPGAPNVVVENVPGAGSLKLAKMFMQSPATDGAEIATVSSSLSLMPIFDPQNTDFDPRKVHYLVSMTNASSYCYTLKSSGIATLDAFLTKQFKVGATGKDSTSYIYPAAIKRALGAHYDIVTGFQGSAEVDLAMERGDIQARCGVGISALFQGDDMNRYNVIFELSTSPRGQIKGVPFVLDQPMDPATHDALKLVMSSGSVHYPFIAAPGTSDARLAELRQAFEALKTDQAFIDDAHARGFPLIMTSGIEVESLIDGFLASDPAVMERARALVQ